MSTQYILSKCRPLRPLEAWSLFDLGVLQSVIVCPCTAIALYTCLPQIQLYIPFCHSEIPFLILVNLPCAAPGPQSALQCPLSRTR